MEEKNKVDLEASLKSEKSKNSLIVHLLIATFGISAWIGINSIFVELPLLVNSLPEKWNLPMYLVIMIQVANIGPMAYILARKFNFNFPESYLIFALLLLGASMMSLLAFFYKKTLFFRGKEYSAVLFAATFFTALVNCSSSLLFMPYLRHFRESYLASYYVGEGLSGIIPSAIALIQGTGSQCDSEKIERFSPQYYFISIFIILLFSLIAFLLLDNLELVASEKVSENTENVARKDENLNHKFESTLRIYFYILLGLMCLLANGFLPGIQSFSSLPYGNITYHLTATLSLLANPIGCFLAVFFPPKSWKIINWLSTVTFLNCSHVIYLAFVSPRPPLQYSVVGKVFVILSWILLIGLISYVKLALASIFRHEAHSGNLFRIGIVMQIGSAFGAVLSLILSSFTKLLESYDSCSEDTFPS
ncbi:solute carrier family 52, riboflavin transporter, member 3-A-like [Belonocnema kinseyi]|uniref:solute carrier family 52, riboflavin transporter, member 3-A-like n=1 Tax=Belonocnema kinseyi TaxID=2817044 RepID=UPI00143D9330|nr:solute carrier family 52, riboflavin transporter, member 3-A-like [Belonocnema kinseyi]